MRLLHLLFIILSATQAKPITKGARPPLAHTTTDYHEEMYMGEPFLTQKVSLTDLWFQITGKATFNVW